MTTELARTSPAPDPLRQVVKWIVEGQGEADIRDAIAATWPDAKARPLIVAAMKELAKQAEPDMSILKGFVLEGTREIYRKALEVGDQQTALRALAQLLKLAEK